MSGPFLRADGLTVRFGGLTAVDGLSLDVDRGEFVGLIGPNGAGKTTAFGAMLGAVPLASGRVHIDDADATTWPVHRRARAGVARTFQQVEVFGSMTVRENLDYATEAPLLGASPVRLLSRGRYRRRDDADAWLHRLGLADVADVPAGKLPVGTARLVELGRALCTRPRLLLLDEPSSGLDPSETRAFEAQVKAAAAELEAGVLLIEHDMSLVTGLCERLYVLDFGRLIADGPTTQVVRSPEVKAAYLGTVEVAVP